jgi:hypothetical protein
MSTVTSTNTGPSRPKRSSGRVIPTVLSGVFGLVALAAIVVGGIALAVHATQRDGDGFYTSGSKTLATPTYALVSDDLDVGKDPEWLFEKGRIGTIRVAATGSASAPIFVGVARKAQVDAYLGGVQRDTISDFELDPFSVSYHRELGTGTPEAPTAQHFWARSTSGSGTRTLAWPVQKGDWRVVVMNSDGSQGVRAGVRVGAKSNFLLWLGIGVATFGGLLAFGAGGLLWHTRRSTSGDASAEAVDAG